MLKKKNPINPKKGKEEGKKENTIDGTNRKQ